MQTKLTDWQVACLQELTESAYRTGSYDLASLDALRHTLSAAKAIYVHADGPKQPVSNRIRADELVLYARNTGELYAAQRELARDKVTLREWLAFVQTMILPRYRKEIDRYAYVTDGEAAMAASELMAYYRQHITE